MAGRAERVSARALGRATLARQLLLERASNLTTLDAIERLVGMQGQAPHAPYVGLWTRLEDFRPGQLSELIVSRDVVRAPLMRATIHLVSARDCLSLRPAIQPVLERSFGGAPFDISGAETAALLDAGRAFLAEHPSTRPELGAALAEAWPDVDSASLAQAITYLVPVVQVTPRGVWGRSGAARWTTVEAWLGQPLADCPSLEVVVLRYLAAFGPATVRDVQTWSGLTRLAEVADRLRPRLRVFRDEHGAELLDLPEAPRPDPETPAPPRFLPEYDNLLLSHADRTRFIAGGERVPLPPGPGARSGTLLEDGVLTATWRITITRRDAATLVLTPLRSLRARKATAAEGERLLRFVAPDVEHREVRFAARSG
ncbi:MAG: winged helix DNA-binding domain-containing protein [Solirubrobacteraceae bacterium]